MSDLSSLEKQLANEKEAHHNQLYELHMEAALEQARCITLVSVLF